MNQLTSSNLAGLSRYDATFPIVAIFAGRFWICALGVVGCGVPCKDSIVTKSYEETS